MCFCNGEYLKLTFSRVIFVVWYMRLVFLYFLVSPSVLEVGIDSWFLTCMSRHIDFCLYVINNKHYICQKYCCALTEINVYIYIYTYRVFYDLGHNCRR